MRKRKRRTRCNYYTRPFRINSPYIFRMDIDIHDVIKVSKNRHGDREHVILVCSCCKQHLMWHIPDELRRGLDANHMNNRELKVSLQESFRYSICPRCRAKVLMLKKAFQLMESVSGMSITDFFGVK